jgi:predicted secreted protein
MSAETIDVPIDTEFQVRLTSSPSTGYVWDIADEPNGIKYLGKQVEISPGGSAPGNPSTQVFRCHALTAGTYVVNFVLKRKWEPAPIETHTVTVRIS